MTIKKTIILVWELIMLLIQTILTLVILSVVIPFVVVKTIMEEIYVYGRIGINNLKQTDFIRRFRNEKS
tara:strand:- start:887 stop:1093 length:207 start_codon:yes stop_codon:yes gene_type:complete